MGYPRGFINNEYFPRFINDYNTPDNFIMSLNYNGSSSEISTEIVCRNPITLFEPIKAMIEKSGCSVINFRLKVEDIRNFIVEDISKLFTNSYINQLASSEKYEVLNSVDIIAEEFTNNIYSYKEPMHSPIGEIYIPVSYRNMTEITGTLYVHKTFTLNKRKQDNIVNRVHIFK